MPGRRETGVRHSSQSCSLGRGDSLSGRCKGDVMFKAILLSERDGKVAADLTELDESRLPEGEVTVAVEYSTLNYKDGMVLNGLGRLVRSYPPVPGVDFAGTGEARQEEGRLGKGCVSTCRDL